MEVIIKRIHLINNDGARELIKQRYSKRSELVEIEQFRKDVKAYTGADKVHLEYIQKEKS